MMQMNNYKSVTLEGFQDHLYPESHEKRQLVNEFRAIFDSFGYEEMESPILEYYDMFEDAFINKENTFKFFDGKGRIIVLRPDLTMPMARIATTKLKDVPRPLKLSYSGNLYRFIEAYGKSKEIYEAGVELIGLTGVAADAEVLSMAIEALKRSGLKSFQIEIGHADIFHAIVLDSDLTEEQVRLIQEFIDKKDLMSVERLLNDENVYVKNRNLLVQLGSLYGDVDVLQKARELSVDCACNEAMSHIEKVANLLIERGYGQYISIDLGLVHQLNYYTGIIFKGITFGVGYPVVNGGRYDHLLKKYGQDDPSVGFAININELLEAIHNQKIESSWNRKPSIYIGAEQDCMNQIFSLAQKLRQMNWKVREDMKEHEVATCCTHAKVHGYKHVLFLQADGMFMLIDVASDERKETTVKGWEQLEEALKWII